MELIEKIESDYKNALKSRNDFKVSVLRMLKSALKNLEIEKGDSINDQEATTILEKQAKQRRDSIDQYQAGGRNDLAETEKNELMVIEQYLPEKMTKGEIEEKVEGAIKKLGATSMQEMGQVIKEVMSTTANQADGKTVSEIVRSKLA
ncbi:MAG: GatB/YqeY domain-containing protein [bacterium]